MLTFLQLLLTNIVIIISQNLVECWPDPHFRSKGAVWPQPQFINIVENASLIVDAENFNFVSIIGKCEIIDKAIERYQRRLFKGIYLPKRQISTVINVEEVLSNLTIVVDGSCTNRFPQFGMDESYKLNITNGGAILRSKEVWGALRGLESFAHLFFDGNTKIHKAEIRDYPRFSHRGVLLDTARHYLSVDVIKANIELMAQNKFNTFHWHIVDIESFPYRSEVLPNLVNGAYTPNHIYTISQIKDIINYGRLRGIRVVPEFDTPGHMKSWGVGVKGLLSECYYKNGSIYEGFENLLDPTKSGTWDVLIALFQEIFSVFPDNYIHLGGDEASFWTTECWALNPVVKEFMNIYGLEDVRSVQVWYFNKFITLLHALKAGRNKKFILWQEAVENGNVSDENLIAHIWKDKKGIKNATDKGYYAILSTCWYLDYISSSADWKTYYNCDPQDFNSNETQKRLVLGGEAALWGEWVNESNVISRLWPRASAVAERLWSSAKMKNAEEAWPRLYEMQCRMTAQGYPIQPANGPGYCEHEYKIQLPLYE